MATHKVVAGSRFKLFYKVLLWYIILLIPYHTFIEFVNGVNIVQAIYNSFGGFIVLDVLNGITLDLIPWYNSSNYGFSILIYIACNIEIAIENIFILSVNLILIIIVYNIHYLRCFFVRVYSSLYTRYIIMYSMISAFIVDVLLLDTLPMMKINRSPLYYGDPFSMGGIMLLNNQTYIDNIRIVYSALVSHLMVTILYFITCKMKKISKGKCIKAYTMVTLVQIISLLFIFILNKLCNLQ